MSQYAILRHPGHNQVYFKSSANLALQELQLMNLTISDVKLEDFANISYLTFTSESPLDDESLHALARLSSIYALFEKEGDNLRPIALTSPQVLDRSLATILKYQGKTNEIFTRMLLNMGLSQLNVPTNQVKLLDPVAGRGTTLFEALSLGADVYGIEIQEKSVNEGFAHLKKFLEQGKIKHKTNSLRVSGPNKSFFAKRHSIDFTVSDAPCHFELLLGDSKFSSDLFPPQFFHLLIGDLPYGIQHGNQAGGKQRSPAQLLTDCLGSWHKVLKKEGVLVLSWNALILPREKMEAILRKNNFQVLKNDQLDNLSHQVDTSILRDIVICTKAK